MTSADADRWFKQAQSDLKSSEFYTSEINRYCHLLVKALAPVCIILHGSVARGTFTPRSDVDVLVIGATCHLISWSASRS